MADLNELDRASVVKVAGVDPITGLDDSYLNVDTHGSAQVSLFNASGSAIDFGYGTVSSTTIRTASHIGNATGAAAYGSGTTNSQVMRVVLPTDQSPLSIQNLDQITSGIITISDSVVSAPVGDGTFRSGTSTVGSYLTASNPGGISALDIQLSGTISGIYYFEASLDSTTGIDGNWINLNCRQTGIINTSLSGNSTTAGVFRGNASGFKWVRVRNIGGVALNTTIKLNLTQGTGSVFLNASIPSGTNIIGGVAIGSLQNLQNGIQASVFPSGELRVQNEPTTLFVDTFPTTLDTINNWSTPFASGGGAVASTSGGAVTLGSGTTANGYSVLTSQPMFHQVPPGWLQMHEAINIEFPVLLNAYRFFGFGTAQAVPTASNPISNGMGFEIATNGKLYAVTYSAGIRFVIADLSASTGSNKQPADSSVHKYYCFFRSDLAYWCIDTIDNLVATMPTGLQGPSNNTLPILNIAIAGPTPPASNAQIINNSSYVADTSSSNISLSDGAFPFRKATIKASGQTPLSSDLALVVALSPNSQPTLPSSGSKFTFGDVTTTTTSQVSVERTVYTEQLSNSAMTLVSTSTVDTSAGTGARTVMVTYLDSTGAGPFTVNFILNGMLPVTASVSNMCFIEKITVLTSGVGAANAGTLTLKAGAVTVGTINVGDNQTFWAHHYVPVGKITYVSGFSVGSTSTTVGAGSVFVLKASTPTIATSIEIQISDFHTLYGQSSTATRNYNSPIQIVGPARIRAYSTSSSSTSITYRAAFDYIDN